MSEKSKQKQIIEVLKHKSTLKHDVYKKTVDSFEIFKTILQEFEEKLRIKIPKEYRHIPITYDDKGEFEAELKIAGDIVIFNMHSNIFYFDRDHGIWKTSYIKENNDRAYCGVINIYNFLSDSVKYRRQNDLGYLIARVFINHEGHYFVEGKKQIGVMYNNFNESVLDEKAVTSIVESALLYSLDFDLLVPPFDDVKVVTVEQMLHTINNMKGITGKRLGFKFLGDQIESKYDK